MIIYISPVTNNTRRQLASGFSAEFDLEISVITINTELPLILGQWYYCWSFEVTEMREEGRERNSWIAEDDPLDVQIRVYNAPKYRHATRRLMRTVTITIPRASPPTLVFSFIPLYSIPRRLYIYLSDIAVSYHGYCSGRIGAYLGCTNSGRQDNDGRSFTNCKSGIDGRKRSGHFKGCFPNLEHLSDLSIDHKS